MEVSRQQQVEGEIPIPINSNTNYATNGHHGHMIHHHHHPHHDPLPHNNNNNNNNIISSNSPPVLSAAAAAVMNGQVEDDYNKKVAAVVVRYRECLKNHAASMGGNATDGCGEFMPSGEEGTIEALNCSACHCHRNFHRKEVEGEHQQQHPDNYFHRLHQGTRKFLLAGGVGSHPHNNNSSSILPSRTVPSHHHMIMPFNYNIPSLPSESDEQELDHGPGGGGGGGGGVPSRAPVTQQVVKKRFRTKFTPEQKEKMLSFADKVGWKLQKQEDSLVQHFCQEIGVKRRVLKVWMHNNKHNLAKKINNLPLPLPLPLPPSPTTT